MKVNEHLRERLAKIKLLLLDIDGTLTDGRVMKMPDGQKTAFFSVRDGHGLGMLKNMGIKIGFISGSTGWYIDHRAEDLNVDYLYSGTLKKSEVLDEICKDSGLTLEQIAFLGDDLPDIQVIERVGFGAAVGDGLQEVKDMAHYVTEHAGGHGAAREVADLIRWAQESGSNRI